MAASLSVADAVGRTPLILLKQASEETGCSILGKAEFMNPGQSVKDRAALGIIRDAIARGQLKPGGTIVEGTAGNTGIGLTEAQVHELLATIGKSSKRDELGFARHEFLGQFGIGLLSCFLVADEILPKA